MTRSRQDRLAYPLPTLSLKDQRLPVPRWGLAALEAFTAGTT
jgi:hypothetical protein